MANKTVYPYGTEGRLPSAIGIVNDRKTGGADKAWSAEQGKLACQDIDKNTEDIFEMFSKDINLDSYSEQTGWFINNQSTWTHVTGTSASNYGCKLIPITPGRRYRVYTHTTNQAIAILASDSMVANSSPDFCNGYNARIFVTLGTVYDFIAPEDAAYLYMTTKSSGNAQDGTAKYSEGENPKVGQDLTTLQSEVNIINSQAYGEDTPVTDRWIILSSGKWAYTSTANAQMCVLIPIVPGEKYRVIAEKTKGQPFALLASDTKADNTMADFCDGEARRLLNAGETYDFTAPQDAAFCYLTRRSASGDFAGYLAIPKSINEQLDEAELVVDSRDGFATAPEYFAWKKMEQMTKLKWTPRSADIQKASATTKFPANTEQTGAPYSSVWEYMKFVGVDVSFHTFMTALRNKYSLMYTECVREGYSKSAYGRTYNGPANSGPFYGSVCSGLTAYALGTIPYTTGMLAGLAEQGVMEVVYDQSANGVKRGDILWQSGHVRMVKDVWRKNGVVTDVLVCEEVQPQAKDNAVMTAAQFNTFLAQNSMIIYRYKDFYKNIKYDPSPYVAVGDETPQAVTYNDDICTFAGDKASFAKGELIYIHCMNLDYPQMELYKGDALLEVITFSTDSRAAITSDNAAYAVNLSNSNLEYGKYKARLRNGDAYSDFTYFEVIDANLTVDGNTASYSSVNGVAVLKLFTKTTGLGPYGMEEIASLHSGSIDVSEVDSEHPVLRVIFQGEYGRVVAQVQVIV